MKKLLLACAILPALAASAQTEKRVIIQDYTGQNCQHCPKGTVKLEDLKKANPTKAIPIAVHTGIYTPAGSPLKTLVGDTLDKEADPGGYPAGSVNFKKFDPEPTPALNAGYWISAYNARVAEPALASVSFANLRDMGGDKYEGDIEVTFVTAPTANIPLAVNVFILEDSIAATGSLSQKNSGDGPQSGKTPLDPWWYNDVLRGSASGSAFGWTNVFPLDANNVNKPKPVVGTKYTKHFTFTAGATWVKKHLHVVGLVAYNGVAADNKKEILNADQASIKAFFPTAVKELENEVAILNAFPNPARTSDIVKVEYNVKETSTVTMRVLNAVGQVVATPFTSYEAAGMHTIQFRAADHNLAAGNYVIQVSTAKGLITQKLTIQ